MGTNYSGRVFLKADDELSGFFTASVGVRAQNYDTDGGERSIAEDHYRRLRAMKWLGASHERGIQAWYDAVRVTLGTIDRTHATLLANIYTPHGWPTWLADRLSAPWGRASFVVIASTTKTAEEAFTKQTGELATRERVAAWFPKLGRDTKHDAMFQKLRTQCEGDRREAMQAYDEARIAREKREGGEHKERTKLRKEAREKYLDDVLALAEVKRRTKFEAKLRRAS